MNTELSGAEKERFSKALLDAFRSVEDLRRMVLYKCGGQRLDEFTSGSLGNRVFELIEEAEAKGWLDGLIRGAHAQAPGSPKLRRFFGEYTASPQRSVSAQQLERIVSKARGMLDPTVWRARLEEAEYRVCRIEKSLASPLGTGFLVAPDVILTNSHVIASEPLDTLQVRFDHKLLPDQTTLQSGTVHKVVKCLARSPHSPVDEEAVKSRLPTEQELDFALLEVAGRPGEAQVEGHTRGWFTPSAQEHTFVQDELIVVLQYPERQPMKVAMDSLLTINANRTRITYRTNTEPGSSGSPCFDELWKLVALHHSGDPDKLKVLGDFNEGIPISTICQHLDPQFRKRLGWI
jgi:V8-like Glu-specific endopeptidase